MLVALSLLVSVYDFIITEALILHANFSVLNFKELSILGGAVGSHARTVAEAHQTCIRSPCGSRQEMLVQRRILQFLTGLVQEHGTPKGEIKNSLVYIYIQLHNSIKT